MALPQRPPRADAVRNRARVLEVAYEAFAADGLAVPIDEIARRAGVGAGTVYRHFPTKEALFAAVFSDRVGRIIENSRALLVTHGPGEALFAFLWEMASTGAVDLGLVEAVQGFAPGNPGVEADFLAVLGDLLTAAQDAGTVRADVGVPELKALMVVCMGVQGHTNLKADRVVAVIEDGLRSKG